MQEEGGGGNKGLIFGIFISRVEIFFALASWLFLVCLPNFIFSYSEVDWSDPKKTSTTLWRDDECPIKPIDEGPGAVSSCLWPGVCPGFTPLPPRLQPELPTKPGTHAQPSEWPKIDQNSEGVEPWGAAGAQEKDQQQGEEANARLEHCHGCPEGGHGALRLLAIFCLLLSVPPARSSSRPSALQDLNPGSGQELHPPPGLISAGDAPAAGGGECGNGGEHRASPQAAAHWRLALHLWPQSAPPHPGVPPHLSTHLLFVFFLYYIILCC